MAKIKSVAGSGTGTGPVGPDGTTTVGGVGGTMIGVIGTGVPGLVVVPGSLGEVVTDTGVVGVLVWLPLGGSRGPPITAAPPMPTAEAILPAPSPPAARPDGRGVFNAPAVGCAHPSGFIGCAAIL